tara:strand:- start:10991 stop:11173 length:183 start_codon:yes stop_codon:yes gene_type:complete
MDLAQADLEICSVNQAHLMKLSTKCFVHLLWQYDNSILRSFTIMHMDGTVAEVDILHAKA